MKNIKRKIVCAAIIFCMVLAHGTFISAKAAEPPADTEATQADSGVTAILESAEMPDGAVISDIRVSEPRPILYFEINLGFTLCEGSKSEKNAGKEGC